jgi:hypothetical protein
VVRPIEQCAPKAQRLFQRLLQRGCAWLVSLPRRVWRFWAALSMGLQRRQRKLPRSLSIFDCRLSSAATRRWGP